MTDSLYRIIDANFNRAREAFRVMEEYCRFALNDASLSSRAKQGRHQLCEALKAIDSIQLLYHRDTSGDIGRNLKIENHQQRTSFQDCFTAAVRRAGEALRALAEAIQVIDPSIAAIMEKLRFEVYSLEKDTALLNHIKARFEFVRLYVLINLNDQKDDRDVLNLIQSCINGGADCIQLRAKSISDKRYLKLAKSFVTSCHDGNVVSIINDRVDIAVLSGADGVHLGQDEIAVSDAKKLADRPLIVGVSTHNLEELKTAIEADCDYVGIGPAYSSPTKPHLKIAGLDYIRQALETLKKTSIYHVAIGGINKKNISELMKSGVFAVAVSDSVTNTPNPQDSCKSLKAAISNH